MKKHRDKERFLCFVYIACCVAIGILFNAVVDILASRYSLTIDMTENGLYQLSEQTKQVIAQTDAQVSINILMKESDFSTKNLYAQVNELLMSYKAASNGNIILTYIDAYANPGFVSSHFNESLGNGSLIVEKGEKRKNLSMDDLYQIRLDPKTGQAYVQGIEAEQKITSAIQYVLSAETPTVYLLQGHGEQYSNRVGELFQNCGYKIGTVNLTTESIPQDATMLVMSGTMVDYAEKNVRELDRFLASGGDLLVLYNLYAGELPILNSYFEDWGIRFASSVVIDRRYCLPGKPMQIYGVLTESEIARSLMSRRDIPLLVPGCRPITLVGRERTNWKTTPLIYSSSDAYARPLTDLNGAAIEHKSDDDEQGPFVLAALAEQQLTGGNNSRVLFAGTHLITSDSLLSEPSWLNSAFLVECINYVGERSDSVAIVPKQLSTSQLTISNESANALFWICVVVCPICILAVGYMQWHSRRTR